MSNLLPSAHPDLFGAYLTGAAVGALAVALLAGLLIGLLMRHLDETDAAPPALRTLTGDDWLWDQPTEVLSPVEVNRSAARLDAQL